MTDAAVASLSLPQSTFLLHIPADHSTTVHVIQPKNFGKDFELADGMNTPLHEHWLL